MARIQKLLDAREAQEDGGTPDDGS